MRDKFVLTLDTIDNKGNEHIIQFAIEDWWVSDLNSFLSGSPSKYNIDALQNSEVLLLEKSERDKLLDACPKMERFFRLLMEAHHVATEERVADSLSWNYTTIFKQNPERTYSEIITIIISFVNIFLIPLLIIKLIPNHSFQKTYPIRNKILI